MKRVILGFLFLLALASQSFGEDSVKTFDWSFKEAGAGMYYSFRDHSINAISTIDILKAWNVVSLEAGVAGDSDNSDWKGVLTVSLDIKQLKLGNYIKLPILDLIEFRPCIVGGLGHINIQDLSGAKGDYGIGATFVSKKF